MTWRRPSASLDRYHWTDLWIRGGWRIQDNPDRSVFRLLDGLGRVRHVGSLAACREAAAAAPPHPSRHAVLLLHGLARTRASMRPFARHAARSGFAVLDPTYASCRDPLPALADRVGQILDEAVADGIETVSFVAFSLGGIVLRHALAPDRTHRPELRTGRAVLIGTPNGGAAIAAFLGRWRAFHHLYGPCGTYLASDYAAALPPLRLPTGVIAGGTGGRGFNPFLRGDNDGTVRVAETRIQGAADTLRVPVPHALLILDRRVVEATFDFIQSGRFTPDSVRQRA